MITARRERERETVPLRFSCAQRMKVDSRGWHGFCLRLRKRETIARIGCWRVSGTTIGLREWTFLVDCIAVGLGIIDLSGGIAWRN